MSDQQSDKGVPGVPCHRPHGKSKSGLAAKWEEQGGAPHTDGMLWQWMPDRRRPHTHWRRTHPTVLEHHYGYDASDDVLEIGWSVVRAMEE